MRHPDGEAKVPVFIFDFGGVVIKWKSNDPIFDYIASKYGIPRLEMRREFETLLPKLETGDVEIRELLDEALGKFGRKLREGDSPEVLWTLPFQRLMKARIGVVNVVKSLRQRGYRVYLFSNTSSPHEEFVRREGWDRLFDGFVTSCELRSMKPSPLAFERALRRIGVRPSDVVFIDDREMNVKGAKDFGIRWSFRFTSVERMKRDIALAIGRR
jgi:HAD superfamily hydrolase (TIGR01549 family)